MKQSQQPSRPAHGLPMPSSARPDSRSGHASPRGYTAVRSVFTHCDPPCAPPDRLDAFFALDPCSGGHRRVP